MLRTICETSAYADSVLGPAVAAQLRARFADLLAADSPLELIAGRPDLIDGDHPEIRISLGAEAVLKVVPNHQHRPLTAEGTTDWSRVRRFRVVSIEGTL